MRGKQSKKNLVNAKNSKLSVFSIVALLLCFVAALGIGGIAAAQSTTLTPFATDDVTVSIEQGVIKDGATGVLTKTDQTVRENDKVKYEITVHNSGAEEIGEAFTVVDTVPEGLTIDQDTITGGNAEGSKENGIYYEVSGQEITWHVDKLAAGNKSTGGLAVASAPGSYQSSVYAVDSLKAAYYPNVEAFFEYAQTLDDDAFLGRIVSNFGLGSKDKPNFGNTAEFGPVFVVDMSKASVNTDKYPLITLEIGGKSYSVKLDQKIADMPSPKLFYFTFGDNGSQIDYVNGNKKTEGDNTEINKAVQGLLSHESTTDITVKANFEESPIEAASVSDKLETSSEVGQITVAEDLVLSFEVTVPDVKADKTWTNKASVGSKASNEVKITEGVPKLTVTKTQKLSKGEATQSEVTLEGADSITYEITVKNEGSEVAEGIKVEDTFPGGDETTLKDQGSIAGNPDVSGHKITWTLDQPLPFTAGGDKANEKTFTFTIDVPDIKSDYDGIDEDKFAYWKNTAKVTFDNDPEKPEVSDHAISSNETVAKQGYPELKIEKKQKGLNGETYSIDPLTMNPSRQVDYEITVTNTGSENATGVSIKDTLPEGESAGVDSTEAFLTLVEDSVKEDENGTADEGNKSVTWTVGTIAPDASKQLHFSATAPRYTSDIEWKNVATGTFENDPSDEKTTSSNTVVFQEKMASVTVKQTQKTDDIEATDQEIKLSGGETLTYEYTVTNPTETDIDTVGITVNVPEGLTIASRSSITPNMSSGNVTLDYTVGQNRIHWNIGHIAGGSSETLTIKAQVPDDKQPHEFVNKAEITYQNMPSGSESESNSVTAILAVPAVSLSKTAAVVTEGAAGDPQDDTMEVEDGQIIQYAITVDNTKGLEDAKNIKLTDVIPAGLTYVAESVDESGNYAEPSNTVTWDMTVAKGESKTVHFNVNVPNVGVETDWKNVATATYENNPNGAETEVSSNEVHLTQGASELQIEKTQSIGSGTDFVSKPVGLSGNEDIYYKIVVSNSTGSDTATNLVVTDKVPDGIDVDEASLTEDQGELSENTITWKISSLAESESKELTFKGHIGALEEGQTFNNSASVNYDDNAGSEIVSNTVSAAAASYKIEIAASQGTDKAQLSTDQLNNIANDDTIYYNIHVANTGTASAKDVKVVATLTGGAVVNAADINESGNYDSAENTITWDIPELGADAEKDLTFDVKAAVKTGTENFTMKAVSTVDTTTAETDQLVASASPVEGEKNSKALSDAIKSVKETLSKTPKSENGSGLTSGTKYATGDMVDTLNQAIDAAQAVLDKKDATQEDYNKAVEDLYKALDSFEGGLITAKATPRLSASIPSSIKGNSAKSYTLTYNGDGKVTVTSSNKQIATVSYTASSKKISITPKKTGKVDITISATEGKNYKAASKKYTVSITYTKTNTNTNTNNNKNDNTNTGNVKLPFTDVRNDAWFYAAVQWSYSNKLLTGYDGTTLFGPNDNLTRGQAAVILWRWFEPEAAAKYKEANGVNSTPFADNLNGKYYTGAMNWAYKQGIFTGYEGTNLVGVYDSLTRQQMCTVMYRCATKLSHTTTNYSSSKFNSFPDKAAVAGYAKTGMAWCVDKGVISGWDNKYLAPTMTIDRAQMSQIMMNAVTKNVLK